MIVVHDESAKLCKSLEAFIRIDLLIPRVYRQNIYLLAYNLVVLWLEFLCLFSALEDFILMQNVFSVVPSSLER